MSKFFKIGLALGGGGARGLAHLGVLKVLEREGIQFDLISGASFGAIAGAMYAQDPHCEKVTQRICEFLNSEAFRRTKLFFIKKHYEEKKESNFIANVKSYLQKGFFWGISLRRASFISEREFLERIDILFDNKNIEETLIPFVAVATSLADAKAVSLSRGSLRRAVAASCAIPGVFPPITIENDKLIDGGWVSPVPIAPLVQREIDFIIAVDTSEEGGSARRFTNGLDIVLRAGDITRQALADALLTRADWVIRPEIGKVHWSDFWRYEEAIQKGEEAASLRLDELRRLLQKKKIKKLADIDI